MIETAVGVFFGCLAFGAAWAYIHNGGTKKDTTDGPGKNERSNMILFTDHATGVQYVGVPFFGLSVRVDKDGKPYSDIK